MIFRRVVQLEEVYETIMESHLRSQHAGHSKTFSIIKERFYGISREEVVWLLRHGGICLQTQPSNTRAPLEPIHSGYTLERVQIDLVDMRATPHEIYHWISSAKKNLRHDARHLHVLHVLHNAARTIPTQKSW